jgi:hypothetical protein
MTPKEKAKELVYKMNCQRYMALDSSKQCALIAVDEILLINKLQDIESQNFWQEVKQEINKL